MTINAYNVWEVQLPDNYYASAVVMFSNLPLSPWWFADVLVP